MNPNSKDKLVSILSAHYDSVSERLNDKLLGDNETQFLNGMLVGIYSAIEAVRDIEV